jgi:hypothetical protein
MVATSHLSSLNGLTRRIRPLHQENFRIQKARRSQTSLIGWDFLSMAGSHGEKTVTTEALK